MKLKQKIGYGMLLAVVIAFLIFSFIPSKENIKATGARNETETELIGKVTYIDIGNRDIKEDFKANKAIIFRKSSGNVDISYALVTDDIAGRHYTPICLGTCDLVFSLTYSGTNALTSATIDKNKLRTQFNWARGQNKFQKSEIYYLDEYQEEVKDYSTVCVTYNDTGGFEGNWTYSSFSNCTQVESGSHLENRQRWKELTKEITLKKGKTYYIDIRGYFNIDMNLNSQKGFRVDVIPLIKIATSNFMLSEMALWTSGDFSHRQCFNLTNNMAIDIVNGTFNRTFNVGSLVAAGKMQSDYDDLKVVNAFDVEYPYNWTVFNSSDLNIFWRKPNNFTASLTESVCFYYGNPSATNGASAWREIYQESDDFNDNSISTSIWQVTGTRIKEVNGYLEVESITDFYTNMIGTKRVFNFPVRIDFEFNSRTTDHVSILYWGAAGNALKNTTEFYIFTSIISTDIRNDTTNQIETAFTGQGTNFWNNASLIVNATNFIINLNGTSYYHVDTFKSIAPSFTRDTNEFWMGGAKNSNISIDNFKIYTYLNPSPTYSDFGAEQNASIQTIIDIAIAPATAYTNSTLNCSANYGDFHGNKGNVTITWYNSSTHYSNVTILNVIVGQLVSNQTLTGIQAKGEEWNCTINATDSGDLVSLPVSLASEIKNIAPSIILYAPINRTNTSDNTPDFIFNYTDADANGTNGNCILYVNASNVGNNGSVVSSKNTTITSSTLNNGMNQQWYVNCSDELNTTQSAKMIIGIDTISPFINATLPKGEYFTYSLPYPNLPINFSYVELNRDTCWYYLNASNLTIANCQNTSINLTTTNNLTMYVYINDSIGSESYNTTGFSINLLNASHWASDGNVTESDEVTFTLQINSTNITSINATFYYNNSAYNYGTRANATAQANFTNILSIPFGMGNVSYYWNYTLNSHNNVTQKYNLTVYKIDMGLANSTFTTRAINFSIYDEKNRSLIYGDFKGNFLIWANDKNINKSVLFDISNKKNFTFGISPAWANYSYDLTGEYTSANYVTRFYYVENGTLNNATQEIGLYDLDTASDTLFIQKVQDTNQFVVSNALINTQRYYPEIDDYKTVQISRTDDNGETSGFYQIETVLYRHIIVKRGITLLTTERQVIVPKTTPYTIIFTIGESLVSSWEIFENLSLFDYYLKWNNVTKIATFYYNDISGSFSNASLFGYWDIPSKGEVLVCSKNSTASSATLTCDLSAYSTGTFIVKAFITRAYPYYIASLRLIITSIQSDMGIVGLFLAFFIILVSGFAFIWHPIAGIWAINLSIIFVTLMGFAAFSPIFIFSMIFVSVILTIILKS